MRSRLSRPRLHVLTGHAARGVILSIGLAANAVAAEATDEIVITGKSISDANYLPTTTASVPAETIAKTVNVLTPEDTVKYLPNILIRQRHIGDTQSPITTRTSGVGASARSLIYVDGVLISSLIGNNNTSASPKWGLVAPDAIERVDVLYGPFAAAYAGNSIGTVVAFTTRMPEGFEANAQLQGALQAFAKYGDDKSYGTVRVAGDIGDRIGNLAFRLSYNHLDNRGQPLTYATATVPAGASAAGTPVTGAFNDANRTGAKVVVLGANGIEHQVQDNLSGRVTYDVVPQITVGYTFGLFMNGNDSTVNSYLRDSAQRTIYAGAVNIGGRGYTIAPSAFSNNVYRQDDAQLAQGLSVKSDTGGVFDFEIVGTLFDTLKSRQRIPSAALPGGFSSGAGTTTNLDGTGWYTADAKGTWRPTPAHVVTFGLHQDRFKLKNPRYALTDWISGADGARVSASYGKSRTQALWIQDQWAVSPGLEATVGGRLERWKAFEGLNLSTAPVLNVTQPAISHDAFSPKFILSYGPTAEWRFKGSVGLAYRFPTVTELYQAITTGATLSVPNPNLKPERALSSELSAERVWETASVRLSVFEERIHDTLLSQSAPLPAGSTTLASYVQNVDRPHATGVEVVARARDVFMPDFDLSGWVTFVDAKIDRDVVFPAAVGKRIPQVPHWRGAVTATYAPTAALAVTVAGRYSDRAFGTLDNTDYYANTYQGFGAYLVADIHLRYQVTDHLAADAGVNNLNDRSYFLFHPFPQRTVVAGLKVSY